MSWRLLRKPLWFPLSFLNTIFLVSAETSVQRLTADPLFAEAVVTFSFFSDDALPEGQTYSMRTRIIEEGPCCAGDTISQVSFGAGSLSRTVTFVYGRPGKYQPEIFVGGNGQGDIVFRGNIFTVRPPFSETSTSTSSTRPPPGTTSPPPPPPPTSSSSSPSSSSSSISSISPSNSTSTSLSSTFLFTSSQPFIPLDTSSAAPSETAAAAAAATSTSTVTIGGAVGGSIGGLVLLGLVLLCFLRLRKRRKTEQLHIEAEAFDADTQPDMRAFPTSTETTSLSTFPTPYGTSSNDGHVSGYGYGPQGTSTKAQMAQNEHRITYAPSPTRTPSYATESVSGRSTGSLAPLRRREGPERSSEESGTPAVPPRGPRRDTFVQNLMEEVEELREVVRHLEAPPPSYVTADDLRDRS